MNITLTPERIGALAQRVGVSAADLAAIISRGESHSYKAGDYLYHESTPRLWMGIVEEGKIEIVRGLHGSSVRLATLTPGTGFSEGVMPGTEPWPFGDLKIALKMAPIFSLDPATGNMRAELLHVYLHRPHLREGQAGLA